MKTLDIEPHLKPSHLILFKGLDKTVKLYRFVGDVESEEFERAKDYFYHITPTFVLTERIVGFEDYDDIGYYCQENDVWIVEEIMQVPFELTISYEKQLLIDEKDRRERSMLEYVRKQKENIAKIDEGFEDATYPKRRRDHVQDLLFSSRVYIPEGRSFFSQYGVMYLVREQGDYMARVTNSKFDNDLCNTTGVIRGVYCYTPYRTRIASLINEVCTDETEEFRRMYSRKKQYKGIPEHHSPILICPKCHKPHKPHIDCKYHKKGLY